MTQALPPPDAPLEFIQKCVRAGRLYWTYHINMRLVTREISRLDILAAVDTYEIIEKYPTDKYFPSFLIRAVASGTVIHILFGIDVEDDNVRVVTAYRPDPAEWDDELRKRMQP